MMKLFKFILPILFLSLVFRDAGAQTYGNEWIDFNKTYYKIKVGQEGIYRVSRSVLQAAGIPPGVNGSNFFLIREGKEVPVFVSTSGAFGGGDYIEFYGEKPHGEPDKPLFSNPDWLPNDRINLFTDTAVYFLGYDNQTNHERYQAVQTGIPPNPPAPQGFAMVTTGIDYLKEFANGRNLSTRDLIFLSLFDTGEGFVDTLIHSSISKSYLLPAPGLLPVGNSELRFSLIRNSWGNLPMNLKAELNGQEVAGGQVAPFEARKIKNKFSTSVLNTQNNLVIKPSLQDAVNYELSGVSFIELTYPRDFDLSGKDYFRFSLPPSSSNQYLEINNFDHGGNTPKLYDLTNKKWYPGDISISGKTRFYIEPSINDRLLVLCSQNGNQVFSAPIVKTIQFKNYAASPAQGDFIILTHSFYETSVNGKNYIEEYKNYRSSAAGGSRSVVVADVEELYDQFYYGLDMHPLAIRNFLKFAYDKWNPRPKDVFIIGKGVYYSKIRSYYKNIAQYSFKGVVPPYGEPGSDVDFVNFLPNRMQAINIGRLSAWTPAEVGVYLEKVKSFEAALASPAFPTHESESWKKKLLHAAGGRTAGEQAGFLATLNQGAAIMTAPSFGGQVTTVAKNTTAVIDPSGNEMVDSLMKNGLSYVVYHGHSSPSGFEFNLNNPQNYPNLPRTPHFMGLGCDVAQIFTLNPLKTISERYLLVPNGGSVSMIASDNLQYPNFHALYLPRFYSSLSRFNYGGSIGDHHRFAYDSTRKLSTDDYSFMHIESMLLQADPAIKTYGPSKPDFHVAANRISAIPVNVTTSLDSFTLKIVSYNLAKSLNDTVRVKVEHINPANQVRQTVYYKIANLYLSDTSFVSFAINKLEDIGINKYKVTIDDEDKFDEVSEANNTATLEVFIYSDNLVPVYPKEFAIVNNSAVTLKASTLNPFRNAGTYRLEIDTSELFNSALKQQTTITSRGGVIKWTPPVSYSDSTVYYWRTAFDSLVNGAYQWSYSSFIYLENGSPGWNQSHYHQYLKNSFSGLSYGSDREFKYPVTYNQVFASNAIYDDLTPGWPWNSAQFVRVALNGSDIQRLGCPPLVGTVQVTVFDGLTNKPWKNDSLSGTAGAYPSCINGTRNLFTFEFPVNTPAGRAKAAHFLDSIPDGNFVLVRNIINRPVYDTAFVDEWKTDPGQNLYQAFHNMGFDQVDSFNQMRPFIFFRKKGEANYPVYQFVASTISDTLEKTFVLPSQSPQGQMNSVVIGPAKEWRHLKWSFSSKNNPQNDHPSVAVYGLTGANASILLYKGKAEDTSLSFIDASLYPNIRMEWTSLDSVDLTSPQLNFWRVLYSPVPEAALNPAAHFVFKDSLQSGELFHVSVAIENLTDIPMDSMLVRYRLIDENNSTQELDDRRYRKLSGGDTLHAAISFDSKSYGGNNVFFIEANPEHDQPEQYHPNNLGYLPFKVETDERNPLIDVTFDGVHILDRDLVSSRPFIKIVLRDENQFLPLDDTSLLSVSISYPGDFGNAREVPFDGKICRFIPAQPGARNNEAVIEYRPALLEDGIYELQVNGKDRSGNRAGKADYKISFEVVNKSSITHVLNYPNPFSTSTAFLFTLTGSEIPSQFKIQIMTVTGKIVREITKQELGPIHIGRNITEYKWDGKDQYGQLLGNGVYLYRVVTSMRGEGIEHRSDMDLKDNGNNVDKFFKNGYGKMYIMR